MNIQNNFESILFPSRLELTTEEPSFFVDTNLNQIVDAVIYLKEEYDLKPFFFTPLIDAEEIIYRQQIMKDLEHVQLLNFIKTFADYMYAVRRELPNAKDHYYEYQKERLILDAINLYCDGIASLSENLKNAELLSNGFLSFREYLNSYISSENFTCLISETKNLLNELSSITYSVLTNDLKVQVIPYNDETDYSEEIENTFEKFKRASDKNYISKFSNEPMNHVEAAILKGVAALYPEIFQSLCDYFAKWQNFRDETIMKFDREIQFYVSYLEYISKIKQAGLLFCYPEVSNTNKEVCNEEGFDLALANKLIKQNEPVVCNNFFLRGKERIIIVSGPNQGGKTTFARMFAQLHYLAVLGLPVSGKKAKLFLFNKLFTHFEKEENLKHMRSKLEDDLIRIHDFLQQATSNSIIIMNEILSSTTLQDAVFLSKKIMQKIDSLDVLCVWVTFIDQLLSFSEKTVSMLSTVMPDNPAVRTFKVERKPADGLAYALSIAEKYRVTYEALKERIQV
ncbi:MAG TPA: hypothetical protein VFW07_21445 [Parafilimonas sp.]|nr:hypothetical protein [Parafilimonas sp.]